ncbi:hypothetical protein EAT1b_0421 [Exiguobacterium sp. AT1b]|uniref:Uncharacterized protein n=1 Tax=Exiguobacterium sp. (strain ATCC BAA-1283 / AT1b) TaxID=360911 RepID=C4L2U5_EXISA|nr:hypothetical protein EAT1b_0421 [Exiguobacterium sp. AT1b]
MYFFQYTTLFSSIYFIRYKKGESGLNFDETNVEHLHVQSFQTMDLFTLKHGYLSRLPAGSYRVTDYCELDVMVTSSQLGRLRYIDLTLPLGVYIGEKLFLLYDPYRREIYSTQTRINLDKRRISTVDFLSAYSREFHDPDSFSLKKENLFNLPSDSNWREFGLPKVKSAAAFLSQLLYILDVTSFQTILKSNRFLSHFTEWADQTKCEYSIEHHGRRIWSNDYMVTCNLSNVSESDLLQLVTMIETREELEEFRFLIETEACILSLFILGDVRRGYGVGVFQYESDEKEE